MSRKIIVTAALTGAFQGKSQCAGLPEQPDEIAQAAMNAIMPAHPSLIYMPVISMV